MISLFLISFLLLVVLWNLYYSTHWNKNLTVNLAFCQDFVYAGEQAELTEQIENRKDLMLPVLEVAFHMDKKLSFHDCENTSVSDYTYKRDIFALLGNQRITRRLTLDCNQRGYYQISQSYLTAFSMLHRRRFSIECPTDTELYVYAARTNISDILVSCERLMGNIQCAKRLYEDPFAFSSIREYTITDPMNTINWKASARTGELMVNTFESTLSQKVMLYLDLEDRGILKYEHLIEESISIAAALARKFISRGMEVGICINVDGNIIEPAGGKRRLTYIEQLLAKCNSSDSVIPFTTLLKLPFCPQENFSYTSRNVFTSDTLKDVFHIFISKNAIQNQTAIEQFVGNQQPAVWVIPYARGESCDIATSDNLHLVKREVGAS